MKKKKVLGRRGWLLGPLVAVRKPSTIDDHEANNQRIRLLYDAWTRASAEADLVARQHERRAATADDVERAREKAEAAWRPYKRARAKAVPRTRSFAAPSRF